MPDEDNQFLAVLRGCSLWALRFSVVSRPLVKLQRPTSSLSENRGEGGKDEGVGARVIEGRRK